jgi:hypothetical protein
LLLRLRWYRLSELVYREGHGNITGADENLRRRAGRRRRRWNIGTTPLQEKYGSQEEYVG